MKQPVIVINSFDEINFSEFDAHKDLVGFDLDDTTWVESMSVMQNGHSKERVKFLDEIRRQTGGERVIDFLYDNIVFKVTEESLHEKMKLLKDKGVITMGLTARRTGKPSPLEDFNVVDRTFETLKTVGISFDFQRFNDVDLSDLVLDKFNIINPNLKPFAEEGKVVAKNGVVFTNNMNKGLVLATLFQRSNFFPKVFVYIDDSYTNLIDIQGCIDYINEMYDKNIELKPYLYRRVANETTPLNPEITQLQLKYLLKDSPEVLSDLDAKKVLGIID